MSARSFEVPEQSDSEVEFIEERRPNQLSLSDVSAPGSFRSVITDYDPSRPSSPDMPSPLQSSQPDPKEDVIILDSIQISKEKAHVNDEKENIDKPRQSSANGDFWRTPSYIEGLAEDEDAIRSMNADIEGQDNADTYDETGPSSAQIYPNIIDTDSEDIESSEDESEESMMDDSDESMEMECSQSEHAAPLGLTCLSSGEVARDGRDTPNDLRAQSPEISDDHAPQDLVSDFPAVIGAERNNRGRKLAVTLQNQAPRTLLLAADCLKSPDPEQCAQGSEVFRPFTRPREGQSKESRNQHAEQSVRRESIPPLDFDRAPDKLSASFGPAAGPFSADSINSMSRAVRDPSPSDAAMAKAVDADLSDHHPRIRSQGSQRHAPSTVPMTADYLSSDSMRDTKNWEGDCMEEDDTVPNMNAVPEVQTSAPTRSPLAELKVHQNGPVPGDIELPSISRLKEESMIERAEPATGAFMGHYLNSNSPPQNQTHSTHPHREKIKVGDLVDSPTSSENSPPRGLKRKAHQISEAEEDLGLPSEEGVEAWLQKTVEKVPSSSSQTAVTAVHAIRERAAKRAKTGQERHPKVVKASSKQGTGRVFAKYAATAVSGAVAGAVGVIALLVNLPDNYFG